MKALIGVRDAIHQGLIPRPRLAVATRAIVISGGYGPAGFDPRWEVPQGAEVAEIFFAVLCVFACAFLFWGRLVRVVLRITGVDLAQPDSKLDVFTQSDSD